MDEFFISTVGKPSYLYTNFPLQNFEHMGGGHVTYDVNSNMAASRVATAAASGDLQVLVCNLIPRNIYH